MHDREHIVPLLPGLRRFAVALIAPHEARSCRDADELVLRAVQRARREGGGADAAAWRRSLYGALVRSVQGRCAPVVSPATRKGSVGEGLQGLEFQHRAALLLIALESFSYDEAAAILGVSRNVLTGRLAAARQALARQIEPPPQAAGRPVPHLRLVK